jgi:hypothetical protein
MLWKSPVRFSTFALFFCLFLSPVSVVAERVDSKDADFQPLFNSRDLQGWDVWLGASEVPPLPFKFWGEWEDVLGLNPVDQSIFSVVEEDGEPALRISGEVWGALTTRESYRDYHLRLQYKWGEQKFAPRADKPRNTGLLYHAVGPQGAFWSYWMRSAEFEIMEGSTGNLTSVDSVSGSVQSRRDWSLPIPWLRYAKAGEPRVLGGLVFRMQAQQDLELPSGEWNDLELIVRGDSGRHLVNGVEVLVVENLRQPTDAGESPLLEGRLQLQSEGAEVFFRHIELRELSAAE